MRRVLVMLALGGAVSASAACGSNSADIGPADGRPHAVVLVVVDALRADHLGAYGYRARDTSPQIDRWAERGLLFERAWAASSWTLPSFGSILTGYLPSAHAAGVEVDDGTAADFEVAAARNFVTLPDGVPTVAALLAGEGFDTGAFVANPFLDPRFGLGRGFAYYDHDDASNTDARTADEVVDRALAWIDERGDKPFFVMVHLMDAHLNYGAPAPFGGRFTAQLDSGRELPVRGLWPIRNRVDDMDEAEREFIVAAYDEEVAYVDAQVGRLLDGLEQRGLIDTGLVLLTADHGEELFDHGGFEHGHSMYDEVLRVPMVLWGQGVRPGRETLPVSHIDIAPTLLAAAGATHPAAAREGAEGSVDLPGIVLLDTARRDWPLRRAIIAERLLYGPEEKAIVEWPDKLIFEVDSGNTALFDLQADPAERHDLARQEPELVDALLGALTEQLAAAEALGVAAGAEIDEELLRRLRALGYIR